MTNQHSLPEQHTMPNAHRVSGATAPTYHAISGQSMGTTWSVKYRHLERRTTQELLISSIQKILQNITDQMSTWKEDSTISLLNQARTGWYQIPNEFFYVLSHALDLAKETQGDYDPTVGELVNLWGFGAAGTRSTAPANSEISAARLHVGWHKTQLDPDHRAVWQPGDLQFDLSSIAKGYGVDQIAAVLDQYGIEHYLVELGGELKARGLNPHTTAWALHIEAPHGTSPNLPISLADCAIATSGDYRRYFQQGTHHYAHTISAATGYPLSHNLASVSVLHNECMMADALATALLCLGPTRGPTYARENNIPALFMHRYSDDLAVEWTAQFQALTQDGSAQ